MSVLRTNLAESQLRKVILLLAVSTLLGGALFSWLWQRDFLLALVLSFLLLSGGGLLLSFKKPVLQAVAVGAAIGAFVGSLIAVSIILNG